MTAADVLASTTAGRTGLPSFSASMTTFVKSTCSSNVQHNNILLFHVYLPKHNRQVRDGMIVADAN